MADEESVNTFCAFTSATPQQAEQYLTLADGNVEQAVELFFSNPDLGGTTTSNAQPSATREDPIEIDDDDDFQELGGAGGPQHSTEDDEAMARRLQEEMYGGARGGAAGGMDLDEDGVRAPMARTTETLVGPGSDWRDDPDEMQAAITEQLLARQRQTRARPGIFNQQQPQSIWAAEDGSSSVDPEQHRREMSRATGGASEATSKSNLLADLFRPPFDLISPLAWSDARDEGKEEQKWILINVQDPSIFDCQVLNRDIWKNASIRDTVKEHFIFLQYGKDDPRGQEYLNYYFAHNRDNENAYPHIAIVDPRTGEQVKLWSGSPTPKASEFLMELHEFLDRYSLDMESRNPVQSKRKERKKDVAQMSEEEMLQMAMQNSLANGDSSGHDHEEDPDALTRSIHSLSGGKGKAPVVDPEGMDTADMGPAPPSDATQPASGSSSETPFSRISSTAPHSEPDASVPASETTRVQFRYSGGRVVRKFLLSDPVRRLYEWLKAEPVAGKEGKEFEAIAMGRNLIEDIDKSVAEAGLKNATVMLEFVDE